MKSYLFKFTGFVLITLALSLLVGPFKGNPFVLTYQTTPIYDSLCQKYPESCVAHNVKKFPESFTAIRYAGAITLLLLGILVFRMSYTQKPGIAINPQWAVITGDFIAIFFLSFAAYCVWAVLFERGWGIKPYLCGDDMLAMDFIALAYIPTTATMAFFYPGLEERALLSMRKVSRSITRKRQYS